MDRFLLFSCATAALALSTLDIAAAGRWNAASLTVQTQPRRLSETSGECTPTAEGGKVTVQLSPYTLEAKFGCAMKTEPTNKVVPDIDTGKGKCCDSTGKTCVGTISDAVGVNGSTSMDKESSVITVKLDDTPTKPEGKLYYKCTNKSEDQMCIVTVDMPHPLGERQCNFDRSVNLPTIAEPNKEEKFECGGTVKTPATDTQVFKGPECTGNASKLGDLVPGAKLTKGNDGSFTFSVAALPSETQHLCFKCVYPDPRKDNADAACNVTVTVSATSKTTTASTTSAGEGTSVSSSAVVAFAFFTTASFYY
ncbi:srs domain-containing protein [Cystoisospora suis]|uniref:Srs domain-containing protein n=1 Tax=Cystoisospora suis TaxID=483139 RepID=A0A2C6KQR4_9APIC|nr:srs domain-containing protein [Cystoisospora suis]